MRDAQVLASIRIPLSRGEDSVPSARRLRVRKRSGARRRSLPVRGCGLIPTWPALFGSSPQISDLAKSLPGRNCCRCGAPTCLALAEDIALGRRTMARDNARLLPANAGKESPFPC